MGRKDTFNFVDQFLGKGFAPGGRFIGDYAAKFSSWLFQNFSPILFPEPIVDPLGSIWVTSDWDICVVSVILALK